ncbi:MAG TPA: hypothetical protein VN661_05310 [Candidatus Acidoferrales bacterium]|nr:hypothetical protein [Candidatus Acidoferrales bacterium]
MASITGISIVFGITIIGIFLTKTAGFGKYTSSLIILVLALYVVSLFFGLGKIDATQFMSLIFAAVGFGGGLIANKQNASKP